MDMHPMTHLTQMGELVGGRDKPSSPLHQDNNIQQDPTNNNLLMVKIYSGSAYAESITTQ